MKKLFSLILIALLCLSLFAGCGREKTNSYANGGSAMPGEVDSSLKLGDTLEESDRKIIVTVNMRVETKTFDSLISGIEAQVSELKGYIQSSDVSGNSASGNRYASITVRIPSDSHTAFTDYVTKNCNVLQKQVSTDDATLKYIDIQSRIDALKAEKTALEDLLKNAGSVGDIITVQERLTQVISQLESYSSQLRSLENLVSYSTVTLRISEVERVTVVEEQSVWGEIGTNLGNNFASVGDFLVDAFVFIVSAIPYLLLLAFVGVIAVGAVMLAKKKKNNKNQ